MSHSTHTLLFTSALSQTSSGLLLSKPTTTTQLATAEQNLVQTRNAQQSPSELSTQSKCVFPGWRLVCWKRFTLLATFALRKDSSSETNCWSEYVESVASWLALLNEFCLSNSRVLVRFNVVWTWQTKQSSMGLRVDMRRLEDCSRSLACSLAWTIRETVLALPESISNDRLISIKLSNLTLKADRNLKGYPSVPLPEAEKPHFKCMQKLQAFVLLYGKSDTSEQVVESIKFYNFHLRLIGYKKESTRTFWTEEMVAVCNKGKGKKGKTSRGGEKSKELDEWLRNCRQL